jgi:hypothetical protein
MRSKISVATEPPKTSSGQLPLQKLYKPLQTRTGADCHKSHSHLGFFHPDVKVALVAIVFPTPNLSVIASGGQIPSI